MTRRIRLRRTPKESRPSRESRWDLGVDCIRPVGFQRECRWQRRYAFEK